MNFLVTSYIALLIKVKVVGLNTGAYCIRHLSVNVKFLNCWVQAFFCHVKFFTFFITHLTTYQESIQYILFYIVLWVKQSSIKLNVRNPFTAGFS